MSNSNLVNTTVSWQELFIKSLNAWNAPSTNMRKYFQFREITFVLLIVYRLPSSCLIGLINLFAPFSFFLFPPPLIKLFPICFYQGSRHFLTFWSDSRFFLLHFFVSKPRLFVTDSIVTDIDQENRAAKHRTMTIVSIPIINWCHYNLHHNNQDDIFWLCCLGRITCQPEDNWLQKQSVIPTLVIILIDRTSTQDWCDS